MMLRDVYADVGGMFEPGLSTDGQCAWQVQETLKMNALLKKYAAILLQLEVSLY